MSKDMAYLELVVAIILTVAAWICGIVGKNAKKQSWVLSFIAVATYFLAVMEFGYRIPPPQNVTDGSTIPILMYLLGVVLCTAAGGAVLREFSWLLGRACFYIGATMWGAVLLAYRTSQKAKASTDEEEAK